MDVDPAYATFVGNAVGMKYKTMFVTQTEHDSQKVKTWVDRQRAFDRFSTMKIEVIRAPRYKFEVTDELRRLGVVGWLDGGACIQCILTDGNFWTTQLSHHTCANVYTCT